MYCRKHTVLDKKTAKQLQDLDHAYKIIRRLTKQHCDYVLARLEGDLCMRASSVGAVQDSVCVDPTDFEMVDDAVDDSSDGDYMDHFPEITNSVHRGEGVNCYSFFIGEETKHTLTQTDISFAHRGMECNIVRGGQELIRCGLITIANESLLRIAECNSKVHGALLGIDGGMLKVGEWMHDSVTCDAEFGDGVPFAVRGSDGLDVDAVVRASVVAVDSYLSVYGSCAVLGELVAYDPLADARYESMQLQHSLINPKLFSNRHVDTSLSRFSCTLT